MIVQREASYPEKHGGNSPPFIDVYVRTILL